MAEEDREKRPVTLPIINGQLYARENTYRSVYGDSVCRRRNFRRVGTFARKTAMAPFAVPGDTQKQVEADPTGTPPADTNKKTNWMSESMKTVIFAAAALFGIIFVVKRAQA